MKQLPWICGTLLFKADTEFCPNAAIVFDMYHIVAQYSKVIDQVRREKTSKAATETDKKVIKGSSWILLKNQENLKNNEKTRLEELLAVNKNLATVRILKDELKAI